QTLIAGKEEVLILADWPPESAAELILLKLGKALRIEKVARIQVVVAEEVISAAVIIVSPGFYDYVDIRAGCSSELSRIICSHDLEFGDGVRTGPDPYTGNKEVLILNTIQGDLVRVRARTVSYNSAPVRRQDAVHLGHGNHSGPELRQLDEI